MFSDKLKNKLHEIIFEAETPEGKLFDVVLLLMIFGSIAVIILESVPEYNAQWSRLFFLLDWIFTIFFTIEYFMRILSLQKPKYYIFSFFGIVDLLSILPSYLTYFFPGIHTLMIIRSLRLLRIFRIFKLGSFMEQGNIIITSIKQSRNKLIVFTVTIIILVCIFGSIMYLVEHNVNKNFDSIPRSIYWSIVTITTVGYGDISPSTSTGQFLASMIMLLGYVIIAIPTGIVTNEIFKHDKNNHSNTISCPRCAKEGHAADAIYCSRCAQKL